MSAAGPRPNDVAKIHNIIVTTKYFDEIQQLAVVFKVVLQNLV